MKLTMLGTGNALVTECYNTCFVIEDNKQYFMVDGGGGSAVLRQLKHAGYDWMDMRHLFVTHKHVDHLMGIIWMVRMIWNHWNFSIELKRQGEVLMKLTVLVDNNTLIDDEYCFLGEPALSYFLEDGDVKVLFDTGYSDVFLKNAALKGIDLGETTYVVLSHGHNDHANGLAELWKTFDTKEMTLITHPMAFLPKALPVGEIGAPYTEEEAGRHMKLQLSREPVAITDRLWYLGEIPRVNDFENKEPLGRIRLGNGWEDDFLPDDSALVYQGRDGLYIITGCSHCGICNITEYARKITGVEKICGIIGGFHLLKEDDRLNQTIAYLEENTNCDLHPCHCVSLGAKIAMARRLPVKEVGVGMEFVMV